MTWRLAADAVVLLHLAFVLFVVAGGLAVLRWPRLAWVHLPGAAWGAYAELTATLCPLTPLENMLRRRAGDGGYDGGFVEHYLLPLLYPVGLTAAHQRWIGIGVVAANLAIYAVVCWRRRAARRTVPAASVTEPR